MPNKGEWVEIEKVILKPEERMPGIPEETSIVPLLMRVSGFLEEDTELGEDAQVRTRAGRAVSGRLLSSNPPYNHTFGEPVPELLRIGPVLRSILAEAEEAGQ